jgi:Lon protease-like protein
MTNMKLIPLFPLNVVILPTEEFYLHIFEPRYKQLILEAKEEGISFGIPFTKNGELQGFGTIVKLKTIFSTYPDGELDISVVGTEIFKLNEPLAPIKDKLYDGAVVYIFNESDSPQNYLLKLRPLLLEYLQLKKGEPVKLNSNRPESSFDAAALLNFAPEIKYKLISLHSEQERLIWLINELKVLLQARKMEIQLDEDFYLN